MKTPIYDFVSDYIAKNGARLHMPGHKGRIFLGAESRDITEICGADSLFEADGIIAESEKNASNLFDTKRTVYSCEGSTLSIKAMLYLAAINRENKSERPVFVAATFTERLFMLRRSLTPMLFGSHQKTIYRFAAARFRRRI